MKTVGCFLLNFAKFVKELLWRTLATSLSRNRNFKAVSRYCWEVWWQVLWWNSQCYFRNKIKLKVLIISSIITEFCFLQKYKFVKLQILQEKNHKKKIKRKSATSLIFDYSKILLSLNEPPGLIILCWKAVFTFHKY